MYDKIESLLKEPDDCENLQTLLLFAVTTVICIIAWSFKEKG